MFRLVVVVLGVGFLALLARACGETPAPISAPTTPAPIMEDEPGWDCWTMGNGWCGPVEIVFEDDGTASVYDNPPNHVTDDNLVASGLEVVVSGTLPDPCGPMYPDKSGPGRSGPISGVIVLDNVARAAVIHAGADGPCTGAVAPL